MTDVVKRAPNEPQDPAPVDARPHSFRVLDGTNVRYDHATEHRLLASLVADVTIWPAVEGLVRAEQFHDAPNRHIFAAIEALHGQGRNPWPPQVIDELRQAGLLEVVGGAAAIDALAESYQPGSRQRAADDARLIAHYARARSSLQIVEDLREAAGRADHDAFRSVLQRATEQLVDEGEAAQSWNEVDVAQLLEGGLTPVVPTMLERSDGQALIYPNKTHAFNAEPEAGKSFLATWLCAERIAAGEHVLYIDFEADAESVLERLLACGVSPTDATEFFHYVRPDDPFDLVAQMRTLDLFKRYRPVVTVLDGVAEVMAMNAWDEQSNTDIAAFLNALPRLFERLGSAVVMIDHLVKDKDSQGRYARGGAHKLAGITGAAYKLEVISPLARGAIGKVKITVTKDRPGWVRRQSAKSRVGEMEVVSSDDGATVVIEIKPPGAGEEASWDGPTHCMEAILAFLVRHTGQEFSRRQIATELRALNLSYRTETIAEALSRLVATEMVKVRSGPRNSNLYSAALFESAPESDPSLLSDMPTNEEMEQW